MSVIIKNATIADPSSPYNGEKFDIQIENGQIASIANGLPEAGSRVIEGQDLYVTPGWVDTMADYCDPGYEHKETIASGLAAAAAGGFTDVFIVPNTFPALSTKSALSYALSRSHGSLARLYVLGAISKDVEGKALAEMMDMHSAGAIAFSDGWSPVQDAGLMVKALEYVKSFRGLLVQVPVLAALSKGGLMNEGIASLRLGMSGIPDIAEHLMVQRDIELLRYTGSRLHFSGISTAKSLDLLRAAKQEGLDVTCSVTPYHLLFTEEELSQYNSVFKVEPPLRTEADRQGLIAALLDGTIDCIATHHRPQDWDAKVKEFEYAQPGMIVQETCFAMLLKAAPQVPMSRWAELLAVRPREIFGLASGRIDVGEEARITLADKGAVWTYDGKEKHSLGINNPWVGKVLTGKTLQYR